MNCPMIHRILLVCMVLNPMLLTAQITLQIGTNGEIREQQDLNSPVIGKIYVNDTVSAMAYDKNSGQFFIKQENRTGWIHQSVVVYTKNFYKALRLPATPRINSTENDNPSSSKESLSQRKEIETDMEISGMVSKRQEEAKPGKQLQVTRPPAPINQEKPVAASAPAVPNQKPVVCIPANDTVFGWGALVLPEKLRGLLEIPADLNAITTRHPSMRRSGLSYSIDVTGTAVYQPSDILIVKSGSSKKKPARITMRPFGDQFVEIEGSYTLIRNIVALPEGSRVVVNDGMVTFYGQLFRNVSFTIKPEGIHATPSPQNENIQGSIKQEDGGIKVSNLETGGFVETQSAGAPTRKPPEPASPGSNGVGSTDKKSKTASTNVKMSYQEENETFLEENRNKAGVITTPSGLQYQILHRGSGTASPKKNDKVRVNYQGILINGKVFDRVEKRNPVTLPVNALINGMSEGLRLMHAGDTFRLFIPSVLAYGSRGVADKIPPDSVLIFDIDLIEIVK